ncbi:MAG: V-type ATP synthase subunit F [Nitrospiria bacterium]
MADVVVIGDPQTVLGFRLTGVTTRAVSTPQDARAAVRDALVGGAPGIVLFDAAVLDLMTDKERFLVEDSMCPILFPIPMSGRHAPARDDHHLARLLRSAIGHHLKIVR